MWEAISANRRRSFFLLTGLAIILIALGFIIGVSVHPDGGLVGAGVALVVWFVMWMVAISGGRGILLGSAGARQIQHEDYPVLFNVVEEMAIAAGLPKPPKVYIMDSDAPNAFAVGTPEESAVAVTSGLLMRLNRDELQGVVAHEIGHVVNNDTRFMTLAGVMVAAIVLIADLFLRSMIYGGGRRRRSGRGGGGGGGIVIIIGLLFAVLAPIAAQLLYFACSRRREYLADACAARFTRYPPGLAGALGKIAMSTSRMQKVNRALAPMFTVNPRKGAAAVSLFSTHPPTEDRIRILGSMGTGAAYGDYDSAYSRVHGSGLIGGQTLGDDTTVQVREPSAEAEKVEAEKTREVVDILHRLNGLLFVQCACGLRTKVPQNYEQDEIRCPRCGRITPLPVAAMAAAALAGGETGILDEIAGEPKPKAPPQERLTYKYTPGRWQSFRCACGKSIQLAPNFKAPHVQCRSCGRITEVQRA